MKTSQERSEARIGDKRSRNELVFANLTGTLNSRTMDDSLKEELRIARAQQVREQSRVQLQDRKKKREDEELRSTLVWKETIQKTKDREKMEDNFVRTQQLNAEKLKAQRKAAVAGHTLDAQDSFEENLQRQKGLTLRPYSASPPALNSTSVGAVSVDGVITSRPVSRANVAGVTSQRATTGNIPPPLLQEQEHQRIISAHLNTQTVARTGVTASLKSPLLNMHKDIGDVYNEQNSNIQHNLEEDKLRIRLNMLTQNRVTMEKAKDEAERERILQRKLLDTSRTTYQNSLQLKEQERKQKIETFCRNVSKDIIDLAINVAQYRESNYNELVPQHLWRNWLYLFKRHGSSEDPKLDEEVDSESDEEETVIVEADDDVLEINMSGLCKLRSQWLSEADKALLSALSTLDDSKKDKDLRGERKRQKANNSGIVSSASFASPDPANLGVSDQVNVTLADEEVPAQSNSTTSLHSSGSSRGKLILNSSEMFGSSATPVTSSRVEKDHGAMAYLDNDAWRKYIDYNSAWSVESLRSAHSKYFAGKDDEYTGSDNFPLLRIAEDKMIQIPANIWSQGCVCGAVSNIVPSAASSSAVDAMINASEIECICGVPGVKNNILHAIVSKVAQVGAQRLEIQVPVLVPPKLLALALIGKSHSGKTTQCKKLAARFALQVLTPQSVVAEAVKAAQKADPAIFNSRNTAKFAVAAGLPMGGGSSKRTGAAAQGLFNKPVLPMTACILEQQLLGYKASKHLAKGEALPEDVMIALILNAVQTVQTKRQLYDEQHANETPSYIIGVKDAPPGIGGFILVDYPTNQSEARALEKALSGFEMSRAKRSSTGNTSKNRALVQTSPENVQPLHAMQPGEPFWTSCFHAVYSLDLPSETCLERAAVSSHQDIAESLASFEVQQSKLFSWLASFGVLRVLDATAPIEAITETLDELTVAAIRQSLDKHQQKVDQEKAEEKKVESDKQDKAQRLLFTTEPVDPPAWVSTLDDAVQWCENVISTSGDVYPPSWNAFRDRPLALLLSNAWISTEAIYKRRICKLFRALRTERKSSMEHINDTMRLFTTFVRRPDNRFQLVEGFKNVFNSLPLDFRADDNCKDELLLRTEELREQMYQILEHRREEAEVELVSIVSSGTMEYRLVALCIIYLCLIQLEIDRYMMVVTIAHNFFNCLQDITLSKLPLPPLVSTKYLAAVLANNSLSTVSTMNAVQQLANINTNLPTKERVSCLVPALQSLFDNNDSGKAGSCNKKTQGISNKQAVKNTNGSLNASNKALLSLLSLANMPTPPPQNNVFGTKDKKGDPKKTAATRISFIGDNIQTAIKTILGDAVIHAWQCRVPTEPQVVDERKKRKDDAAVLKLNTSRRTEEAPEEVGVPVPSDAHALAKHSVLENPEVDFARMRVASEEGFNFTLSKDTVQSAVMLTLTGSTDHEFSGQLQSLLETENALFRTRLSAIYCTSVSEICSLATYCKETVSTLLDNTLQAQIRREHDSIENVIRLLRQAIVTETAIDHTIFSSANDTFLLDYTDSTNKTAPGTKILQPMEI